MAPGVVVCWSGGDPRLQTIRIPANGLILGREHASETDDRISRQHVRVQIDGEVVVVEDVGSRNGTYVNRYQNQGPVRSAFPAVIRAGRTVFVVVPEIEIYEELHEGRVGAALDRARKEIEDAARAEQNVTVEAGVYNSIELVRRYCDTLGGNEVIYEPGLKTSLDASLANTRPRVVVLRLTTAALSYADIPTVSAWLETDVRFVTVTWPRSRVFTMIEPGMVAQLRERVISVENPRYDELPFRVRDIARKHAPGVPIHASVCEGMCLKASQYDEEWVIPRFTKAVAAWFANPDEDHARLHMRDLVHEIEPPPSGAHCLVGDPHPRRRSF